MSSFSKNRSDGDATPREKLKLNESNESTHKLLADNVINEDQVEDWRTASGEKGDPLKWDKQRALAFQRAVEKRTFDLYQRFYNDLVFKAWGQK